jgi:hypothetical protein
MYWFCLTLFFKIPKRLKRVGGGNGYFKQGHCHCLDYDNIDLGYVWAFPYHRQVSVLILLVLSWFASRFRVFC